MKTIEKNGEIKRATNDVAEKLVNEGWSYCPKSKWKKIRDKK